MTIGDVVLTWLNGQSGGELAVTFVLFGLASAACAAAVVVLSGPKPPPSGGARC